LPLVPEVNNTKNTTSTRSEMVFFPGFPLLTDIY